LTEGDLNPLNDNYLDLNVNIQSKKFIFKIYHKVDDFNFKVVSYPFPKSNVHSQVGYNTFLSQLIRFGRVCSLKDDFVLRARFVYNKLVNRGYIKDKLSKTFIKFCAKYPEIPQKFGVVSFRKFNDDIIV